MKNLIRCELETILKTYYELEENKEKETDEEKKKEIQETINSVCERIYQIHLRLEKEKMFDKLANIFDGR